MRLLDTDTCIEILRGNRAVAARRRRVEDRVATTWITAAELYYGAARSARAARNRDLVTEFLSTLALVGLDRRAVGRFGEIKAALEGAGRRVADFDLLIAASALSLGAVLVTGNARHYGRIPELALEDWIR